VVFHGSLGTNPKAPAAQYCAERVTVTPPAICDHVEPHHRDVNKFWLGPFQSLCKSCHDSTKRFVETRGFRPDVGLDGWLSGAFL